MFAATVHWRRLKYFLFLALGLMFLFVLWRNERFIVDHSHPDFAFYYPVRWWLIPHALGGLIAFVAGPFQFTHAADAGARIVIQNALFLGRARADRVMIPWCTYTDP